ncbi:MAG TPA: hypothetical protein PL181_05765 [bacterium]|nr:hypothetical protein [bacterium]
MQKNKILFIDNEQFLSRQYIESLIDSGFNVKWANNAKKALAIAKTEHFDAIILVVGWDSIPAFSTRASMLVKFKITGIYF